jgi:hypothetical protein
MRRATIIEMLRLTAAAVVATLAACSGTPPQGSQSDGPVQSTDAMSSDAIDALMSSDACTMLATAHCTQLMTCSPADLNKQFGTIAVCITRQALTCSGELAATDTGASASGVIACADALTAEACPAFLGRGSPMACVFAGPNDGTCAFAAQCGTSFCSIGANALCGVCQNDPAPGAACTANGCGPNLGCDSNNNLCEAFAEANQACNPTTPCDHGLACVGDTKTQNGSCQPQIATLGGACDETRKTRATCSDDAGLTCNTNTNQCVAQPLVAAGQPCGAINGVDTECTAGATCNAATGKCVAPAADGAACDTSKGPGCLDPARCIPTTGTAGTCKLPGSQAC